VILARLLLLTSESWHDINVDSPNQTDCKHKS